MKIHFIGIGGIGVSALAQYYLAKGCKITGSDLVASEITDLLKEKGAEIIIGQHRARHISKNTDLVIYTPAVQLNNPELKQAKKYKIKCQSYPQALGDLTKRYYTIAVAGTHGKSTTTAMIALILTKAGLNPTVILGTKLKEFKNSNFRKGKSKYLVIEADEWQGSFLHYWPKMIVLTNIEREHLDYYKNLSHILRTYHSFITHLPQEGVLVANKDNKIVHQFVSHLQKKHGIKVKWYTLKQKEKQKIKEVLKIPGIHNVSNALGALSVIRYTHIPDKIALKTLANYYGAWRRFEVKQTKINAKPITLVADYAHHPTEIKVTLQAAREKWPKKEIWLVFQPHQHQRTFYLFKDFVKVFRNAPVNKIILTDIYDVAGREAKTIKAKVNSEKLVRAINRPNIIYLKKDEILAYLRKILKGGEVVIIMGAGDIYCLIY